MAAPLAPSWDGRDDGACSHVTPSHHTHTHTHTDTQDTHSHTLTLTVLAHGSAESCPSLPLLSPPRPPVSGTPQARHRAAVHTSGSKHGSGLVLRGPGARPQHPKQPPPRAGGHSPDGSSPVRPPPLSTVFPTLRLSVS